VAAYHDFSRPRNYDARKGQEKGKVVFRGLQRLKPRFQVIDFKEEFGRGEWIRTTGLLVPNQAPLAISLITERIFWCKTSS